MRISEIFNSGMASDPPPSDAECDAISVGNEARTACARLQDPAVWYSGPTGPNDYPPVPR